MSKYLWLKFSLGPYQHAQNMYVYIWIEMWVSAALYMTLLQPLKMRDKGPFNSTTLVPARLPAKLDNNVYFPPQPPATCHCRHHTCMWWHLQLSSPRDPRVWASRLGRLGFSTSSDVVTLTSGPLALRLAEKVILIFGHACKARQTQLAS